MYSVGILTLSDKGAAGSREDLSGPAVRESIGTLNGAEVLRVLVIPDDRRLIERTLINWADELHLNLILTTGGTGLGPRDVTPEATIAICDRMVPGMAEVMRAVSLTKTPYAMVSRAVVGARNQTLVINLPGSPKGAKECLEAILPALSHALDKLLGDPEDCQPASSE